MNIINNTQKEHHIRATIRDVVNRINELFQNSGFSSIIVEVDPKFDKISICNNSGKDYDLFVVVLKLILKDYISIWIYNNATINPTETCDYMSNEDWCANILNILSVYTDLRKLIITIN
jgi:hypothetical protein